MDIFTQSCRVCGCTEMNACPGGCSWVEPDLCSACSIGDSDVGVFARGNAGVSRIAKERLRQLAEEGFTREEDMHYRRGELAAAAACYAFLPTHRPVDDPPGAWPWARTAWKPSSRTTEGRIRELEKAGALIAAEIDRLLASREVSDMPTGTKVALKAFQCDDSDLYAAASAEQAAALYEEMTGEPPEHPYPTELTNEQLDAPIPAFDEDEKPTGEMTSVRQFLAEHGDEPGWLAGSDY